MIWWGLSAFAVIGAGYEAWKWLCGPREVSNFWEFCGACPSLIRPGDRVGRDKLGNLCHQRCL